MTQILMPMATAVWLVDNTALTFRQIAEFCGVHELEIQGVADGTIAAHIVGQDPTVNGQLTRAEIDRCQADPNARLTLTRHDVETKPRTKGPRYTPVSKRQDKPDAIAWLIRHHPELSDLQISRLVGTTKPTIQAIRDRSHWNMSNIRPQDPVGLGLCRQTELDEAVRHAAARREKMGGAPAGSDDVSDDDAAGTTILPVAGDETDDAPSAADGPQDTSAGPDETTTV